MSNDEEKTLKDQKVEHENLIRVTDVVQPYWSKYAIIDGRHIKVYPTGNPDEPWTTSIRRATF